MRPMRIGRAGSPAPRMVGVSTRSIVVPMSLLLIAFHARLPDQKSPDYPAHRMGMHMTPCVRRYVKQHPDICQTMNASYTTRPRCGITSVPTVLDNQPALPKTRPERHNINHTRHDYATVCCRIHCRDRATVTAPPNPMKRQIGQASRWGSLPDHACIRVTAPTRCGCQSGATSSLRSACWSHRF